MRCHASCDVFIELFFPFLEIQAPAVKKYNQPVKYSKKSSLLNDSITSEPTQERNAFTCLSISKSYCNIHKQIKRVHRGFF